MSLEAKAAIVGAMYALQRLFSTSGQAGTDLTNFNTLLGVSAKTLQQYQYAARQVGVSNQETESTFKNLQSTMTKLRMGESAPKGLAQVSLLTGGITGDDIDKFMKNPELLLQKLQVYAQKEKRLGVRNEALKSFGLSDNMVAALSRNAFQPNILKKAPVYSDKEINALDKANTAWSNLGTKISMAVGHLNAAHGGRFIKDLTILVDKVLQLTTALIKLANTLHLFDGIGKVVEGLSLIFGGVGSTVEKLQSPKGRESLKNDALDFIQDIPGMFQVLGENYLGAGAKAEGSAGAGDLLNSFGSLLNFLGAPEKKSELPGQSGSRETSKQIIMPVSPTAPAPKVTPAATPSKNTTQNINVNQNLSFGSDKQDARTTGDYMKKAVSDAFRQLSSQIQGS